MGANRSALRQLTRRLPAEPAEVGPGLAGPERARQAHCSGDPAEPARGNGAPAPAATGLGGRERHALSARTLEAQRLGVVEAVAKGIAHDLSNLMTVVIAQVELLGRDPAAGPSLRPGIEELRQAAAQAAVLTRDLMLMGRRPRTDPRGFDPAAFLLRRERVLGVILGAGVELVIEAATDLPILAVDESELEQVVLNLSINARDAMAGMERARLRIAVTSVAEDGEGVDPGAPDAATGPVWVRFTFEDTGVGMDAALCARVTEPFFTTKPPTLGSGLGLSATRDLIDRWGGTLRIESTPGVGSTFTFQLPARGRADTKP